MIVSRARGNGGERGGMRRNERKTERVGEEKREERREGPIQSNLVRLSDAVQKKVLSASWQDGLVLTG